MKFRKWLFTILTLLSVAWMVWGLSTAADVFSDNTAENAAEFDDNTLSRDAANLGTGIGASLGVGFFLCTGLPFFLLFGFFTWRTNVAIRQDKHHKESLEEMRRSGGHE